MSFDDNSATEEVVVLCFAGPEAKRKEALEAMNTLGFMEIGSMLGASPAFVLARELSRNSNGRLTQGELEALLGIRR
ncbi:hypothetical protein [Oceanidesulfovibrio marinus]|uniref:Uncharacterized protein n=1 Tax=Oceanidesulfovibrio marinus TaxID=370038 RepID=A0A6P1ZL12_9BACT|nr:hypothetical protein [Oceanidesulfovibrio marinus]QJT09883.1 hypothetical protein E8L03_13470 [Oceanidesulfovibrio marinus]TVM36000.1 hypothetical protein DQK91_04965 [Oceanidesulfovibrio marinus]